MGWIPLSSTVRLVIVTYHTLDAEFEDLRLANSARLADVLP